MDQKFRVLLFQWWKQFVNDTAFISLVHHSTSRKTNVKVTLAG